MDDIKLLGFKDWLRDNSNLSESSVNLYARTISNYFSKYDDVEADHINKFVSESVRNKNCYYMKYSFKHYLTYIGKPEIYSLIVKVKVPPRKKIGKYLPKDRVLKIAHSIKREKYRHIALLQYMTLSRAVGILRLHEDRIDFNYSDKFIRLAFLEKGNKIVFKYLKQSYASMLKKYLGQGYLFLPAKAKNADPDYLETLIQNERKYFYDALKEAAEYNGVYGFGTHDFRRNSIELQRQLNVDVYTTAKAAGQNPKQTMSYYDENSESVKDSFALMQDDEEEDADNE